MKIKPFLVAVGGALATAAIVLALPSPASAHQVSVSGEPVCTNAPSYDVTWTVTSSDAGGLSWSVNGEPFKPQSEPFVFTTSESGDTASFTANAEWSDGYLSSATGSTARPPTCTEDTTTTTVEETTTTAEETTTTAEETTTTAGETTTTAGETTTTVEDSTTTTVGGEGGSTTTTTIGGETTTTTGGGDTTTTVGGEGGGTTTTTIGGGDPTTTVSGGGGSTTTTPALPSTGSSTGNVALVATMLLLAGTAMYLGGRRSTQ